MNPDFVFHNFVFLIFCSSSFSGVLFRQVTRSTLTSGGKGSPLASLRLTPESAAALAAANAADSKAAGVGGGVMKRVAAKNKNNGVQTLTPLLDLATGGGVGDADFVELTRSQQHDSNDDDERSNEEPFQKHASSIKSGGDGNSGVGNSGGYGTATTGNLHQQHNHHRHKQHQQHDGSSAAAPTTATTTNVMGVGGTVTQFLTLVEFWLLSR
jgi:hypothetical protein